MWLAPEKPDNEAARLSALVACGIMDTPREEQFDRLTWLAQYVYEADVAFMGFIDTTHQWMKSVSSDEIAPSTERPNTICQSIVADGKPLISGNLHIDERFIGHPSLPDLPFHFYAGVPIKASPDLVIGTLCVMRRQAARAETFDIQPLSALADIAVDELELRRLNRELTRISRIDALTGIANRRVFDEELARASERARRTGTPLSLLMMDIDRFKEVNDILGHRVGDDVLRRVGAVLAGLDLRQDDIVCRYGGEEFAVILSGCRPEGALKIAHTVCARLADADIFHPTRGRLTLSIGIASHGADEVSPNHLVAEADSALYEAKRRGRDTIVAHAGSSPT